MSETSRRVPRSGDFVTAGLGRLPEHAEPDISEADLAWFDYRAAYGVTAAAEVEARKAFVAGWHHELGERPLR